MAKDGDGEQVEATSGDSDPKKVNDVVAHWINEIEAAKTREKDFRKDGERIIDIYDGSKADVTPFNILYSNTETVAPALYSMLPRPVVQRRFKDDAPLGLESAKAAERMAAFLLDTNLEGYDTFDEVMNCAVFDGILPGRGVTSIKYEFDERPLKLEAPPPEGTDPPTYKADELVCPESREWNRVYFGFARKWSKIPWIAYEEHIDREEAERLFGKEIADTLQFTTGEDVQDGEDKPTDGDALDQGEHKTCLIYKIWDKRGGKKVRFVTPQDKTKFLKVIDDPLGLTGFFDCPQPMQFVRRVANMVPVALYILYENQAKELNELTLRLTRIARAIRARGAYDSSLGDLLEKIMQEDDNALVPTDQEGTLSAEKGLDKSIWFMPLQELTATLEKLYLAREQCKQVIYEIMGIADIMRGASKASETLGAQEIKSNWGTLRIKPKQREVQRYARDLIRMMIEVAATKFSEETWAKMTGLPFSTSQQIEQAKQIMLAASLQPPPPPQMGPDGQPMPPPVSPIVQQAQQVLASPAWPKILEMLRTDTQRAYLIDIETNSTIEPEAVEDQKNIAELMNTLGQFLNGVGGLVEKGVMPFEVAQSMMLAISRRYRFGNEIEDQIKAMRPPPPQDDGAAQQAQQQAQEAQQAAQQAEQGRQAAEAKLQAATIENQQQKREFDLTLREKELEMKQKVFDIQTQHREEQIKVRDQVGQDRVANKEKLAHISEAAAKRDQQNAERSKKDIGESTKTLAQASQDVQQFKDMILQVVKQQGDQTNAMVQAMIEAITAPREKIAERDETGRLTRVTDRVAGKAG